MLQASVDSTKSLPALQVRLDISLKAKKKKKSRLDKAGLATMKLSPGTRVALFSKQGHGLISELSYQKEQEHEKCSMSATITRVL